MYVTQHAATRLEERVGVRHAYLLASMLERMSGQVGHVAYLLEDLPTVVTEAGSNGDVVVAIAIEGSVETIYFRRRDQDMSPEWFGVSEVIDLREDDRDEPEYAPEWDTGYEDVPVRGEARAARLDNGRKMVVTGRSALMLNSLVRQQKQRRRVSRRKRGAR